MRKIKEYLEMSSSDEKSRNKSTVGRKRNSNFCSTPVLVEKARRLSSISISAVETNSSSSAPRKSRGSRGQTEGKAPAEKQRKRKRKQASKARRQKGRNAAIDSDSDWETNWEQSVHEEATSQRVSTQKAAPSSESVLFEDVHGSPERVREAPRFFDDDPSQSPVFRSLRGKLQSPEKFGFKEKGILVVEDLPTCRARVDEEADSEELILRRSTVVTYPGARQEKRPKIREKIVECHGTLAKAWYPVATGNLLWDNFLKDNREKISKDISRSALSEHQESQTNRGGECLDTQKSQSSGKTVFDKWGLIKPDLREINATRGYWDKSSKKWVRVEDVYKFPQPEDPEFQKKDRRGRKMTLNEYLRKCRMEKENVSSLDPCSPVARRNTAGSRRLRNDLGTIQKGASRCKNLQQEFERSKVESPLTRSSLKRANNTDVDGSDAKRRLIAKNKPRIRAIEKVSSIYNEAVQKLLELCEKHNAD